MTRCRGCGRSLSVLPRRELTMVAAADIAAYYTGDAPAADAPSGAPSAEDPAAPAPAPATTPADGGTDDG